MDTNLFPQDIHSANQGYVLAQGKSTKIKHRLGQVSLSGGGRSFLFNSSFSEASFFICMQGLVMSMSSVRKQLANLGLELHNKTQTSKKMHKRLVIYTEIEQAIMMGMVAGSDPAAITVGSVASSKVSDWTDKLNNLDVSIANLSSKTYAQITAAKEQAEKDSSEAMAVTDELRIKLKSLQTTYSNLTTFFTAFQGALKRMLGIILRPMG